MADNSLWFEQPKYKKHAKLFEYLTTLENRQSYRERENVVNLGLYEDREVMGIAPGLYVRPQGVSVDSTRVSLNVTGAVCDTAQNMIGQARTLPMALTEGGDWLMQAKAKFLNRFLEGEFYSKDIFTIQQDGFGDGTVFGTGFVYVDTEEQDIICERVFPNEMIVDDSLCEFSPPWEMTRRKYIAKDKLKKMFPTKSALIDQCKPVKMTGVRGINFQVELIPVYTTFRLPTKKKRSKKDKTDGIRIIICETCTLQETEYDKDYFPFVPIYWRKQKVGFFGRGIPSLGHRLQQDINRTLRTASKSVHLAMVPRLLLPTGSNINPEHISNEIGSGIWHSPGAPPSWLQGQALDPELMAYLQFLIGQFYQQVGVSELAAGMKKPQGLNSGEAQRVYADTQADRFALPSQWFDQSSIEIAKRLIACAHSIAEQYGDYEVNYQSRYGILRIPWSKIDLGDDDYMLKLSPINALSEDPAERIDKINELTEKGMLTMKQAKKLAVFPDLEAVMEFETASDDLVAKIIDQIVDEDDAQVMPPDECMDLEDAIKTMQMAKLHYKALGLPGNKLKQFDTWIATAATLQPPQAPAAVPAGPAGLPPASPQMQAPPQMAPG